jgi:hypothetical protein
MRKAPTAASWRRVQEGQEEEEYQEESYRAARALIARFKSPACFVVPPLSQTRVSPHFIDSRISCVERGSIAYIGAPG